MKAQFSRPHGSLPALFLAASLLVLGSAACDSQPTRRSDGEGAGASSAASDRAPSRARNESGERAWRAGFVIVDGVYNTELVAPWDVFEHTAYQEGAGSGIEVVTISPDGGEVRTAEGIRIVPDHSFEDAPPIDILVVPSSRGSRDVDLDNERLIAFVGERGRQASFVVSLCWGSFVLAKSGLLDGHAATTFPSDYDRFARTFPDLDLRVNVSFVHDDRVLTSQGGVLSYDVAMYLVDMIFGKEVAAGVGGGLLIPWPRPTAAAPPFISDTAFRLERSPKR